MKSSPLVRLAVLNGTWADTVTALRLEAYQPEEREPKHLATLSWGPTDQWSFNFGVLEDSKILSAFRIEKFDRPESLARALMINEIFRPIFQLTPARFPTAVFSRTVTARHARGENLSLLLRSIALRGCLAAKYKEQYSTMKTETWRGGFLARNGYALLENVATWSLIPAAEQPGSVLMLDVAENGAQAVASIEKQIAARPASKAAQLLKSGTESNVAVVVAEIERFLRG